MRALLPILLIALLMPFGASAEIIPTLGGTMELLAVPNNPGPKETVRLSAKIYTGVTTNSSYTWVVNGKTAEQGIGRDSISVTLGGPGSVTTVEVSAYQAGEFIAEKSITFRPATIDLVWEGNTSRPPLYIGRPLPNGSSNTTILAVPHIVRSGATISPSDLVYTWSVNGKVLASQSGYGKISATIASPRFESAFEVSVKATTRDGVITSEKTTVVTPIRPTAVVYENAPLLGHTFNKATAGTFEFLEDEASFTAYPLFVSSTDDLSYEWQLDGEPFVLDKLNPFDVTFRKEGGGRGLHSVEFSFEHVNKLFERGTRTFNLSI